LLDVAGELAAELERQDLASGVLGAERWATPAPQRLNRSASGPANYSAVADGVDDRVLRG
jgi:hypothetical protein